MTTKLTKPVERETALIRQMRPVLVELIPADPATGLGHDIIAFRLKGKRETFKIPLPDVFDIAQRRYVRGDR